jgi:O-antigen ligase
VIGDRTARGLLGATLLAFLVVGDVELVPAWPWHAARLALLGLAVAAAAGVVARQPRLLGALARPPLVFFSVFAVLTLVASACADRPLPAVRYAVGFVVVETLAVATAAAFAGRTLLIGLFFTLAVKIALSLAVVASPLAWWSESRFMGALGSPNPMGAAAGLAYLLIVLCGWYDWPGKPSRIALAALGLAATTTLAITRSSSAVAATLGTLVVLAPLSRARDATWRPRIAWAIVAAALLAPVVVVGGGHGAMLPRPSTPAQSVAFRVDWWAMLLRAIWRHPWLGYGAGSTPLLGIPGTPPWGTSAHNLYLEAAVYAGIPAAFAMALFVLATLFAVMNSGGRARPGARVGLAVPAMFYAVLSLGEPVLLNGAPSTLVVPLVVAAACATDGGTWPLRGWWRFGTPAGTRPPGRA